MAVAVFVDTSIMLNLLDVPKRNDERAEVAAELDRWQSLGATFILPVTTIIETGNAVAKIDGGSRWSFIEKFVQILEYAVTGTSPWAASGAVCCGHWTFSSARTAAEPRRVKSPCSESAS